MRILLSLFLLVLPALSQEREVLKQLQAIPLGQIEGPIGPIRIVAGGDVLLAAAPEANAIAVVNLKTGVMGPSLTGSTEPRDLLEIAGLHRVYVASASGVDIYDTGTWKKTGGIALSGGAFRLAYDATGKRIYAATADKLVVIDALGGMKTGEVGIDGKAAALQIEAGGPRLFVTLPDSITTINRKTLQVTAKVPATWAKDSGSAVFDEKDGRLLVGSASPAKLLVMDTAQNKWVTDVELSRDTGDILYDAAGHLVFAICGWSRTPGYPGVIFALDQQDGDHYRIVQKVTTAPNSRAAVYSAARKRLYLAVPHEEKQQAEIRIYQAQ